MKISHLHIAVTTLFCAAVGLVLYRFQGDLPTPAMNEWGIVSFTALGACLGCVSAPEK